MIRCTVAAMVVVVLTAGCTSTPSAEPVKPTPTQPAAPRASGPPVSFDREAQVTFPETEVRAVSLDDELLITLADQVVTVRDVPSLSERFTRTPLDGIYADVWHADGSEQATTLEATLIPGSGTRAGRDAFTFQQFSLDDGTVTRTVTVGLRQPSAGSSYAATARIRWLSGDLAVLDTWRGTDPHRMVAVDLDKETVLWKSPDSEVLTVTDGSQPAAVLSRTGNAKQRVVARAIASGKPLWKALVGSFPASMVGQRDERIIVGTPDIGGQRTLHQINLVSGRSRSIGSMEPGSWDCQWTDATAVCAAGGPYRVVGIDLETGERLWGLPTGSRFAPAVTLVQDGIAYGSLDTGQGVALDVRTGEDEAVDTGAAPVAVGPYGAVALFGGLALFVPYLPPDESSASASATSTTSPSPSTSSGSASPSAPESAATDTGSPTASPTASPTGSATGAAVGDVLAWP